MEISKLKTLTTPELNDVLPILDINGGVSGKPILRKATLSSLLALTESSGQSSQSGLAVPTLIKTTAESGDYFIGIDTTDTPYKITKTNFLQGIGNGSSGTGQSTYIQLTHTLAPGVNPGGANFGSWTDRPINLIDFDDTVQVTLSDNTFVLPGGTYFIEAKSTFYQLADAKLRLFNKTSNATLLQGINGWVNPGGSVALPIFLSGKFTIAAGQQISLQYWAKTSSNSSIYNYGGSVSDGTPEKYAVIDIWKVG